MKHCFDGGDSRPTQSIPRQIVLLHQAVKVGPRESRPLRCEDTAELFQCHTRAGVGQQLPELGRRHSIHAARTVEAIDELETRFIRLARWLDRDDAEQKFLKAELTFFVKVHRMEERGGRFPGRESVDVLFGVFAKRRECHRRAWEAMFQKVNVHLLNLVHVDIQTEQHLLFGVPRQSALGQIVEGLVEAILGDLLQVHRNTLRHHVGHLRSPHGGHSALEHVLDVHPHYALGVVLAALERDLLAVVEHHQLHQPRDELLRAGQLNALNVNAGGQLGRDVGHQPRIHLGVLLGEQQRQTVGGGIGPLLVRLDRNEGQPMCLASVVVDERNLLVLVAEDQQGDRVIQRRPRALATFGLEVRERGAHRGLLHLSVGRRRRQVALVLARRAETSALDRFVRLRPGRWRHGDRGR